ncbi:MAG: MotA/TolQ/ExbB proton channel family protein [Chthoniobacterales bacterium]|jgi:biopolymer transport protein ExbB|nr:MotA/TolQ/ExbB proton channel family protein [Chthoniobacterales bacterium]
MNIRRPHLLLLLTAFLCLGTAIASAEEPAKKDAQAAHSKSLLETLVEGGWVMFPIGIMSILTVYLSTDGIRNTSIKKTSPPAYEAEVKRLFQQGDYVGAYTFCRDNKSPLTNVLRVGISLLGDGKTMMEEGMISEMHKESASMGTQINYLSVIGVVTPMIGLLGTVTGMIKAFSTLGASGIGDPSSLSGAIGEVLVATASGLVIAIPAFGMFYFLRSRSTTAMHHIQDIINVLFRKMPYEYLQGVHISGEEIYASTPNWLVVATEDVENGEGTPAVEVSEGQ